MNKKIFVFILMKVRCVILSDSRETDVIEFKDSKRWRICCHRDTLMRYYNFHEWISLYTEKGKLDIVTGYFTIAALAWLSKQVNDKISEFRLVLGDIVNKDTENNRPLDLLNENITVHGFRSTFRDWVSEETQHSAEVAEMALAHTIKNKVEAAYRRKDLLDRRRILIQDWLDFCNSERFNNVTNLLAA
jgi:integrase